MMSTFLGRSMITDPALYWTVAGLSAESAERRKRCTSDLHDMSDALGANAAAIAGLLVLRAGIEDNLHCYEQVLDTLSIVCAKYPVPLTVLAPLRAIQATHQFEVEYLEDIFENAGYYAEPSKSAESILGVGETADTRLISNGTVTGAFGSGAAVTNSVPVLIEAGLIDWPTIEVGFRNRWMSPEEVESFALARVLEQDNPAVEVVDLTRSQLSELDISERLKILAQGSRGVDERVALRRWLFASLVMLDQTSLDESATMARLQEIYAEFGYPEELRYVSQYNLAPGTENESSARQIETPSPLESYRIALSGLRAELLESA